MGLFSQTPRYLGVDIGTHNIKIVELENFGGRPKLVTYGLTDRLAESGEPELVENPDLASALLKSVLKKAKAKSKKVIGALPAAAVFSSIINISSVKFSDKKELAEAIQWEAKKVIPLPLDEMILYHNALPGLTAPAAGTNGLSTNRFLLTATSRSLVEKYLKIFKSCGLTTVSLEPENFAFVRSLVGNDKSAVMIVDFGEVTTAISVISQGIPILNRSVSLAGKDFYQLAKDSLGLDAAAAERLKRDLSILGSEGSMGSLNNLFAVLLQELNYCFNLYNQENGNISNNKIEKVILTGGSSVMPGLDRYLEQNLKLKVFVGDPWARVIYPEELKPVLDSLGPRLSIAIGLAMREI